MKNNKFKKFILKSFTLPAGKYIINSDNIITVKELVVEMKSIPAKRRKPGNNSGKTTKQLLLEFIDKTNDRFDRLESKIDGQDKLLRRVIKLNNLKTK